MAFKKTDRTRRRAQVLKMGPRAIAEDIAEIDELDDAVWTLREKVCKVMKDKGYLPKDEACVDNSFLIYSVAKRLIDEV